MPRLELTELECKLMWVILDERDWGVFVPRPTDSEMRAAEASLFQKVYNAYRGIPDAA